MAKYRSRSRRLDDALSPVSEVQDIVQGIIDNIANVPVAELVALSSQADTIDGMKADVEELAEEIQNWLDNLPENLQSSMKADELQECVDALEQVVNDIDEVTEALNDVSETARREEIDREEIVGTLEEITSKLDDLSAPDVMFPGMY